MAGEKGPDAMIVCVPARDPRGPAVTALQQVPEGLLSEIRRFPGICEDLGPGRETSVRGFEGREAAWAELTASRERLTVRTEAPAGAGART